MSENDFVRRNACRKTNIDAIITLLETLKYVKDGVMTMLLITY